MKPAEKYLINRLHIISSKKKELENDNNELEIKHGEIIRKISELEKNLDNAVEVFSPRNKNNDFTKKEIKGLSEKKEETENLIFQNKSKIVQIDTEIKQINEIVDNINDEKVKEEKNTKNKTSVLNGIDILKGQETERKRIAMELHDSTVQVLTNLIHRCEICRKFMDVDSVRAKLELEVMEKTLRNEIDELRNIIYNLRPMSFDDMGLELTIKRVVNQAKTDSDIDINLDIQGKIYDIGEVQAITVIRIIQEAVNNSKKYSHGKKIDIVIKYMEKEFLLTISDDGVGFDTTKIKKPEDNNLTGFGLSIMKERVLFLNGFIDIESEKNKGTKITVRIPENTNDGTRIERL